MHKLGHASRVQTLHVHYSMLHNTYVWCMCACIHACMCVCVYIMRTYVHVYVHMYVHVKQNSASCDVCMQGMGLGGGHLYIVDLRTYHHP